MTSTGPCCIHWIGVVYLCLAACSGGTRAINRALERMTDQPRYDAYEESGFFRNGMVMQPAPAGTVHRSAVLGSRRYPGAIPLAVTPDLLATGRSRFRIFCGVCHGMAGYGGSIVASNMIERPPPSLRTAALAQRPPGYWYEVIRDGFGRMPGYASELSDRERWAVVAYARRLRGTPAITTDEQADSILAQRLLARDSAIREKRARVRR